MIRRVLMTADAVGGVWPYALELSQALEAHDITVVLAVMGPPPSVAQRAAVARLRNVELEHHAFALEWMEQPWADIRAAGDWLLGLEAKWHPDVCHLNGYCHGGCAFSVPKLIVAHACVCSWWLAVNGADADRTWTKYRHRVRAGLAAADAVAASTQWMLGELQSHYGVLPRSVVIPNASNPHAFWQRSKKEPFVFSAGRFWDEAKNLRVLDSASRDLAWPVIIAGATEGAPPQTYAQSQLLGELEPSAIADWLARASIYALPARYEPFGLSVLEAALCSCALVLGNIPSLRETWQDAALFVDPSDTEHLHAVLTDLIDDPQLRRDLGARARDRALRHSPTRQAAAYAASYAALTRGLACAS